MQQTRLCVLTLARIGFAGSLGEDEVAIYAVPALQ